jgi:hypothetical protein
VICEEFHESKLYLDKAQSLHVRWDVRGHFQLPWSESPPDCYTRVNCRSRHLIVLSPLRLTKLFYPNPPRYSSRFRPPATKVP